MGILLWELLDLGIDAAFEDWITDCYFISPRFPVFLISRAPNETVEKTNYDSKD